jgi:hypothetical protein
LVAAVLVDELAALVARVLVAAVLVDTGLELCC